MTIRDEARAEAERRFPLWLPTGDYEIDREDYSELDAKWQNEDTERDRAHFIQGAEWRAGRDAVRIADLEAELAEFREREAKSWKRWLRQLFTSKETERFQRSKEFSRQLWRLHQKGLRRDLVMGLPELPHGASWVLTEDGDKIWVELIDTAQGGRISWARVANQLEASRAADEMVERRLDYFRRGVG